MSQRSTVRELGIDTRDNLKDLAERLPDLQYSELERPPRYTIQTVPRQAQERHKERIVAERQFDTLKLIGEEVAEVEYRPVACKKTYRVVVLRKRLVLEKGQLWLLEPDRADGGDPRPADTPLLGDRDGGGELPAARRTPSSQGRIEGDQGGGSGVGGVTRGEAVGRRWTTGRPRS